MVSEISRREVLNNLIRFKDNLLDRRLHDQEKEKTGQRTYKFLLNRKTGDMRFAQKISALEAHISRKISKKASAEDWKEIHMIVQQKSEREAVHFEMRDVHDQFLKPSDLDPLAWRIATETVDVLNKKAKEVKGQYPELLPEEAALQDLSSIHLSTQKERIEDLPGWMGSISRIDAEEKLKGRSIGTYLLREGDSITLSIAFHLGEENLLSIHPYILTVVESDEKISDILLLLTDKGWVHYSDDPNLNDPAIYQYFTSAQAILHHLHQTARHPLL